MDDASPSIDRALGSEEHSLPSDESLDGHGDPDVHHESGHHIVNTVMCVTIMAFLCAIVTSYCLKQTTLCKIYKIPFTLAIFAVGAICSGIARVQDHENFDDTGLAFVWVHSFEQAQTMNPHIIILAILPPLIYESASGMNYHVFRKVMGPAMLLAFPGMILSLVLTGIWARYTFQHNWNMAISMLLGSIVSATDPVAVVAALHELGAPAKLASIIDGESLLNDGSAMVMFLIFLGISNGEESYDFADGLVLFLKLAIVGAAFGLLCYTILSFVLHHTVDSWEIEIAAVLIGVYGTFYFAEVGFHVSGIIAVVTFGVMMSRRGKYAISPRVEPMLHSTMSVLAHLSEVTIFFIAGIVAENAVSTTGIGGTEWRNLFVLYIVLHLIRGTVILSLRFVMNAVSDEGYTLCLKECVVMTWGGLRGAVGLALGLLVVESTGDQLNSRNAKLINFYVSGIVILTMAINGTLAVPIYHALNIYKTNTFRQKMVEIAVKSIDNEVDDILQSNAFKEDFLYGKTPIDLIKKILPDFRNIKVNSKNELEVEQDLSCREMAALICTDVQRFYFTRSFLDIEETKHKVSTSSILGGFAVDVEATEDIQSEKAYSLNWMLCNSAPAGNDTSMGIADSTPSFVEESKQEAKLVSQPSMDDPNNPKRRSLLSHVNMPGALSRVPSQKFIASKLEKIEELGETIFDCLKQCYIKQYEEKDMDDDALYYVMEALETGVDYIRRAQPGTSVEKALITEFMCLKKKLPMPCTKLGKRIVALQTNFFLGPFARMWVFHVMFVTFESIAGYIRAHEELIQQVQHDKRIEDIKELQRSLSLAKKEYEHWENIFPGIARIHRVLLAVRKLTSIKREIVQDELATGTLGESDVSTMATSLNHTLASVQALRFDIELMNNKGDFWGTAIEAADGKKTMPKAPEELILPEVLGDSDGKVPSSRY